MKIRGMFATLCAPLEEDGAAGGGGELSSMAETISTDLFGEGPAEKGADDVELAVEEDATPPAADTPPAPPASAADTPIQPPRTWRPEAAATWAAIPPEAQQEILKREEDIFRGLETYKADAGIGKAVKDVIAPYMPLMQQYNVDPLQQISGLLKAHATLVTGTPEQRTAMFQELAKSYGVQIAGESQPFVDPQVADLQKQLADLQSRLNGREAKEAETVRASLQQEIDTFASDPAHPYFDEVANDIAALLKGGGAKTLQDAYDKAVWANPITRAKEQARLTTEAATKAQAEAKAQASKAKRATSANVTSSAKPARGTAALGSIDDTLTETLSGIRARA